MENIISNLRERIEIKHLTPEELAARLRVCLETVRRKLRDGEIAAIKLGRLWRIPLTSVEAYEKNSLTK